MGDKRIIGIDLGSGHDFTAINGKIYKRGEKVVHKVKECKWCDGTNSGHTYGKDEPLCCLSCGAEWEPVEVEYTDEELKV